jgi:arylsulfatase A-like enzyme
MKPALTLFTVLLLASVPTLRAANPDNSAKPNIVIVLGDDQGIMDTSVPFLTDEAGKPKRYPLNEFMHTPNMERLAAQGIRFNNFYAMSVCSPTRVALMTGQNSARHHVTNWIHPLTNNAGPHGPPNWNWNGLTKDDVTLPRLLQKAGYRTIEVGKGHFGPHDSQGGDPRNLGFDINIAGGAWGSPATYFGEKNYGNASAAATPLDRAGKGSRSAVPGLEKYHGTPTHLTEALTLEANAQIADAVHAGQPFFLYLSHYAAHSADNHHFETDPRFAKNYNKWELTPVGHTWMEADARSFATLVEGVDKSLGDVLDHLDRLGVAENTLVLFLGDNGSDSPWGGAIEVASASPLRGKKGSNYEGGLRVPFIAAWAKPNISNPNQQRLPIAAGTIQSQLAAIYDLFPTILDLAGVKAPAAHVMDGQRLDALLAGRPDPRHNETFLLHYPHATGRTIYCSSYREGDWKVLYHYFPSIVSDGGHYQLFNLRDDLSEQYNLATREPERLRRMMQALITALETQGAQYPVGKDGKTPERPKLPEETSNQ